MQAEDSYVTDRRQTKNDDYVLYCAMLLKQQLESRSDLTCTVAVLTGEMPCPFWHQRQMCYVHASQLTTACALYSSMNCP